MTSITTPRALRQRSFRKLVAALLLPAALVLLLGTAPPAAAQTLAVTDFDDGTTQGWIGRGVRSPGLQVVSNGSIGGAGDEYLRFVDRASVGGVPGLHLLAPPVFRGDYRPVARSCGRLEMDVRVFDDQNGQLQFALIFERDADGFATGADPEVRAVFRLAQPIDESSGWVHVVVPLALLDADGNLPTNADGGWEMPIGEPASDWDHLLARVDHFVLPFEINGGTFEEIGIDNVRLVRGDCPCPAGEPTHVRQAGRADDFRPPTDPVAPRRELADLGIPFKDFDDPTLNEAAAHTFADLPAGIVRAELEVRLRPSGSLSSNDAFHLVYEGDGFAFGTRIRELPEAGGSWALGDPALTLSWDLTDLPGGVNVLPSVQAERRLDLYVQDDTEIDYARLRLWSCPPPIYVGGLPFDGELLPNLAGGVDLIPDPGTLEASAEIDLGSGEGVCVGLARACVGDGEGTASQLALSGRTDVRTDSYTTGTLSLAASGNDVVFSVDWDPDLPVEAKIARTDPADPSDVNKDTVVAERTDTTAEGAVARIDGSVCVREFDYVGFCFRVWLEEPATIQLLPNGPTETGDVILICHDIVVPVIREAFSSFRLSADGLAEPLEVTGVKLFQFGLLSQALGTAELRPFEDGLLVTEIGDGGQDGVAFDLTDADQAHLRWSPLDALVEPPVGARVSVSAEGELGGVADRSLGSLAVTRVDDGPTPWEVEADFAEVGADRQRIQVLSGGQVLADLETAAGVVGSAGDPPIGLGKLNLPDRTKCYAGDWPEDTLFSIAGVDYRGDELRVLLEGTEEDVGPLSKLELRAAGIPEIAVAQASVGTPCSTDGGALCLNEDRFQVEVTWQDFQGNVGRGTGVPLTTDSGYFWFFRDANVELIVKVLDGRPVNGHWWVFYGALSNVEYTLTVTDTATGEVRRYRNPAGTFASRGDTEAFADGQAAAVTPPPAAPATVPAVAAATDGACGGEVLCLHDGRFRLEVDWVDFVGNTGSGTAVQLTSDSGYFWFFRDTNVELVVKVLDGRVLTDHWWVFYGALSNVEYTLTVTDTVTGASKSYRNPPGTFASRGDTTALPGDG